MDWKYIYFDNPGSIQESPAIKARWLEEARKAFPLGAKVRARDGTQGLVTGYDVGAMGEWPGIYLSGSDSFFYDDELTLVESGSEDRFHRRIEWWKESGKRFPRIRHHAWWIVHNCVSHPLLGVRPSPRAIQFHDWTSMHLNCRGRIRPSPEPEIVNRKAWVYHNVVGHLAIGLLPIRSSFDFHDRTAKEMEESSWI